MKFGSDTKSVTTILNQIKSRGWTDALVRNTVDYPFTTRVSRNIANTPKTPATAYYNKAGAYVVVDDVTLEVIQVSNYTDPLKWKPDPNIINPYKP